MEILFRTAESGDLEALIHLLADDPLGTQREDISHPINQRYVESFKAIRQDPNNQLIVATVENRVIGMLQITFIPYLTHIGTWRCQVEGVRIHKEYRGKGLGKMLLDYATQEAKTKGCKIIQLTSDKQRPDALKFYTNLGFKATHEGFKKSI
ncbi:GNAT family N-acetyltransferase [Pleionea sediminis]|uniref:GNAT family N-acetyltransferase n=1 Tax=Pleionea sediminis TaxID=2569479 RepID=UPI0011850C14|nr:GNAT family N-acetyltransferase [Pleionea sediminis]